MDPLVNIQNLEYFELWPCVAIPPTPYLKGANWETMNT